MFRVLIVDDHELIRTGVRTLLASEPRLEVCGEAKNGREGVEQVKYLHPDLVVLDISMPVMGGLEAAAEIRRVAPKTKIVILSMHDSAPLTEQLRKAGADAFVTKSEAGVKLLQIVRFLLEIGQAESV